MSFFEQTREESSFDEAIGAGLSSILVNPKFLFRVELDPTEVESGSVYKISDTELASRLSFFLWSSIPDEELLNLAERGELRRPYVLEQQVARMLADPRARALVENFGGQWLHLRNVADWAPDPERYRGFDESLRYAFQPRRQVVMTPGEQQLVAQRRRAVFVDARYVATRIVALDQPWIFLG